MSNTMTVYVVEFGGEPIRESVSLDFSQAQNWLRNYMMTRDSRFFREAVIRPYDLVHRSERSLVSDIET